VAYWPGDSDGLDRAVRSATRCAELLCRGGTSEVGLTEIESAPTLHAGVGAGMLWAAALGGHPNWCLFVGGEAAKQSARALSNARPGHYVVSDEAALELEFVDQSSSTLLFHEPTTVPADWLSGFLPLEIGEALGRDPSFVEHAVASLDSERAKHVAVVNAFDGLAEVRPITALFARIGELEYELETHQTLFAALQEDLSRYDGPTGELLFDDKGLVFIGVFGAFGSFHRDDASRALEAARAMIRTTRRLGLMASIGVATGDALFRVVGGTRRRQLTALGTPMNRAARLMTALANGVLCDAPTERASRRRFQFAEHGTLQLEGLGDATAVFRPLEPQAARFARAPLFGRERELELLHRAFQEASGGVRRLVIVSGEPGIGKSHLVEAFSESVDGVTMARVERNDRQASLRPWRQVIASLLRLPAETDGATILAELTTHLARDPSVLGRLPLLEAMLGVPVPQTDSTRHLDGAHRADAIMRLLGDVLQALAPRPLTLIVEDSQWLDSASWRLLEWILTSLSSLLVVVCVRTGEAPEMLTAFRRRITSVPVEETDGSHFCRTLDLEDLSDGTVHQIVTRTLASAPPHEDLARRIVELAAGNPFFAEEITLTLKSEGLIAVRDGCWRALRSLDGLRYFEGVERVIRERIDTVDASAQAVLKAAAVIGRSFTRPALTPMLPEMVEDRVEDSLRSLSNAHLVRQTGEDGQYAFRHDQTRDVVYGSIPGDVRQRLHSALANWIEASRTPGTGADTAVLVHHFHAGGSRDKAIAYGELAAARALQTGAFREAEAFLGICLSYETRASSWDPEQHLHAVRWRRQLGDAYYGLGDIKAQSSSIRRALTLAGYPMPESAPALLMRLVRSSLNLAVQQLLPPAFSGASAADSVLEREVACCLSQAAVVDYFELRIVRAFYHAIAAVNHAERSGLSKEAILASAQLACALGILGRRSASRHFITRAERGAIALNDSSARAQVYYLDALWRIGYCEWDVVDRRLDESQTLCLEAGDQLSWCNAQAIRFWSLYYRADQGALERTAQGLLSRSQNSGNVQQEIWALRCKSLCVLHADGPREAVDILRLTTSALPGSADLAERVSSTGVLALALARVGLNGESIEAAVETLTLLQQMGRPTVHSTLPGISGVAEVLLRGREAGLSHEYDQWALWERQVLRHLDKYRRAFPVGRAQYGLWCGVAAALDGRRDSARREWKEALAFAKRFSLRRDESLIAAEIRRAEIDR
jgi:hypothetical protein